MGIGWQQILIVSMVFVVIPACITLFVVLVVLYVQKLNDKNGK